MNQRLQTILIRQLAYLWGAVAWQSYQLQGRGIFCVYVQQQRDADLALTIEYLSVAECHHKQARHLVATYDPRVEYVLLLGECAEDAECKIIRLNHPLADVAAEMSRSVQSELSSPHPEIEDKRKTAA